MITDYLGIIRTFNRNIVLYLTATVMLGFAVDGGVFSVIFNLYLLRLGYGPEFIGQINSAGLTTFALTSLPAGALASRFAGRPLMAVGLGLMIAGCALLSLAESLAQNPANWLMGGFISIYLGMAIYFVTAVTFIFAVASPIERSPVFSAQTALLALSAFIGSLAGGFLPTLFAGLTGLSLEHATPYRYTLIFATVLMTPALIAILRTQPPPDESGADAESAEPAAIPLPVEATTPLKRRWRGIQASAFTLVLLLCIVRFFQVAGIGATATFFNVYMDTELGVATSTIGAITAVGRLVGVPAAFMTPLLVMRWGARSTVAFAGVAGVLSLLPLAFAPIWSMAALGYVGVVATGYMRYPAFLGYSMEKVPARWRGALSGASEVAGGLSFALVALMGGYIIAAQGFGPLFLASAGLTLFGTFLFWAWFMRPKEAAAEATLETASK